MRLLTLLRLFSRAALQAWEDDVPLLGAAISYYSLFSLLPLVMVMVSVAGLVFGEEQASAELIRQSESLAGPEVSRFIAGAMREASLAGSLSLRAVLSIAALAWTAALMFRSLRDAANYVWKVSGTRRWYSRIFADTAVAYALVSLCGVALMVSTLASTVLVAVASRVPAEWEPDLASLRTADLLVSLALSILLLSVLYKVLPATRVAWRDVVLGAVTASLLLAGAKSLIGFYLGHSLLTSLFGAASTLFVLLVWVYGVAWIFLFGAELCHASAVRAGRTVTPRAAGAGRRGGDGPTDDALS